MNMIVHTPWIVAALAVIAGCSTNNYRMGRVSQAEPVYTTPATYRYAETDAEYLPDYDRSYTTHTTPTNFEPAARTATTAIEIPRYSTRTVSMTESGGQNNISIDEFRDHIRNNSAVIVDAREAKQFTRGHVQGAVNIPAGDEGAYIARFRKDVEPNDLIIVYCGGPECPASENVARYLSAQGFTNIRVYKPGWQELSKIDLR